MAFTYGSIFATGVPLNATNLNKCLLGGGTFSSFPAPAPYVSPANPGNAGMMAFATDQRVLYASDGTAWTAVGFTPTVDINDMIGSRALGTYTYQNTGSRPLMAQVSAAVAAGATNILVMGMMLKISSPANVGVGELVIPATSVAIAEGNLTIIVPPGYYYGVSTGASVGVVTLTKWFEYLL